MRDNSTVSTSDSFRLEPEVLCRDLPGLAMPEYLKEGPASEHRGSLGGWRAVGPYGSWAPWVVAGELFHVLTRLGPLAVRGFLFHLWFSVKSYVVAISRLAQPGSPLFAPPRPPAHEALSWGAGALRPLSFFLL